MKSIRNLRAVMMLLAVFVLLVGTTACKSSGVAVTDRAQIMDIDIEGAEDLPNEYDDTLRVSVQNKGINNLNDVEFTVEFPAELVVMEESHGDGMDMMQMTTASGMKLYHYRVGDIQATQSSDAKFTIRTAFGSMERTGDVKVTAWQKDLPGDKLIESKAIKLRRNSS